MPTSKLHRRDFLISVPALAAVSRVRGAVADAPLADWPMANGPHGNFIPRRYGRKLIDDLANAKLLWKSDDTDVGFAKGSASGYLQVLVRRPTHPGSCSGPIVAEGKVFCNSFRPAGEIWAAETPQLKNLKQPYQGEELKKLRQELRIDADDLLIAFDQATGKVAWKAVEANQGLNRYMGKREGFGVAPAYHDGAIFSMGTTGKLRAYDSATGKRLWETDIGKAHQAKEEHKKKCLAAKLLPGGGGWSASLVVAAGVVVTPLFDGPRDIGIRGVDPKSGKTLWEVPEATSRYATPSIVNLENKEYLLTANLKGEARLIEPRTGKVRWSITGLQPTYFSLSPNDGYLFVNAGSKTARENNMGPWGLLAGYRLTPDKAEKAWTMPDRKEFWFENQMDTCAMRRTLIRDGVVYFFAQNKVGDKSFYTSLLDLKTGDVHLTTSDLVGSSWMSLIEDRLFHSPDASHGDRASFELFTADPKNFKRLCQPWKPPQETTTAYEVFLEWPYVDGRVFMRTESGDLRCYDLRADA
jgi:outer membrane protein assembly factor BamB